MQYYKIYLTILLSISIVSTAPAPLINQNQVQVTKYEYVTNENGGYKFEFETSDGQSRSEVGTPRISTVDGTSIIAVVGSFSYNGDDGKRYSVEYTSDENGYHAYADHLKTEFTITPNPEISLGLPGLSANAVLSLVG